MPQLNLKNVIAGIITGGVLGSVSAILIPRRQKIIEQMKNPAWTEKARNIGAKVYDEVRHWADAEEDEEDTSIFVKGALLGLLLGAGSALLLTPKTGKQLRDNLFQEYQDLSDRSQEILEYINQQYPLAKKRPAPRRAAKPPHTSHHSKTNKAKHHTKH